MFHTASIWLTLALAVQRYIYVCHAPLARKFCTLPNVYKCLSYIMISAALHQSTRLFDREYSEVSHFTFFYRYYFMKFCFDSKRSFWWLYWYSSVRASWGVNIVYVPLAINVTEMYIFFEIVAIKIKILCGNSTIPGLLKIRHCSCPLTLTEEINSIYFTCTVCITVQNDTINMMTVIVKSYS